MPNIPVGASKELAVVVNAYLAAIDEPATQDERLSILGNLRLRVIPRNESPDEAKARFRNLVNDLSDVPADALRQACDHYVNDPDTRFFPASAGELRKHINPIMTERRARAYRLDQMHREAERQDERERMVADDPVPPDQVNEWNEIMAKAGSTLRYHTDGSAYHIDAPKPSDAPRPSGPAKVPTVADYMHLGLSQAEAEQAVANLSKPIPPSTKSPMPSAPAFQPPPKPYDPELWSEAGKSWEETLEEIDDIAKGEAK